MNPKTAKNPNGGGRPANKRRVRYLKKYGISTCHPSITMSEPMMDQLDACKDEASRRILLGVSKLRPDSTKPERKAVSPQTPDRGRSVGHVNKHERPATLAARAR